MRHGGKAPWWAATLAMAETWHVPPWIIEDHDDALYWYERLRVYQEERAKAIESKTTQGR